MTTLLVYGAMSLLALGFATLVFEAEPLWLGVILLGTLPTDVSSPVLSATGALSYLALLLAVVGPNVTARRAG